VFPLIRYSRTKVGVDHPVHRPMERLASLDPPVEQPAPRRPLLGLAIRRGPFPRDVPPEHGLVGRRRFSDGAGVHSVVEEQDQGGPPVPADRQGCVPATGPRHRVGGEVEGVDLGLRQVVAAGATSRWSLGPGNRGGASINSCSQAQERTARRCSRALLAVRPGLVPSSITACSWTQSRNSRTSLRLSCSIGPPPPHRSHFLIVERYSLRVPRDRPLARA
jgi:hypothetical protein